MSDEHKTLTETLEDDEWALVIGPEGELKGVFIPELADESQVPNAIVEILATYFNVDFYDDDFHDDDTEADAKPRTLH
jgi:hypothetical protein